jgi:hypothetical protein
VTAREPGFAATVLTFALCLAASVARRTGQAADQG